MARTIEEIQAEIYREKENHEALNELNSTSKTALWRLWIYIVAVAIWSLEKIFDLHRAEIDERLLELKPHTARWYRNKALAFQYGFDLLKDSDKYNNENHTEEEIEASKIIKYAAVVESSEQRSLIIKIAGETGGKLWKLAPEVEKAFKAYISEIKDAGVAVSIVNYRPDRLKLTLRIVRDPLVLDEQGIEILTAKQPVREAIERYMKALPFNGELSLQKLVDEIQKANGVADVSLDLAESQWIDGATDTYANFAPIDISTIPMSGYFAVNFDTEDETKSTINYL
uniref:nucleotidyltransferase n=1 Tax=Ornithobacterium rhinotracheale TaxID=28251 RepID=UPI0039A63235